MSIPSRETRKRLLSATATTLASTPRASSDSRRSRSSRSSAPPTRPTPTTASASVVRASTRPSWMMLSARVRSAASMTHVRFRDAPLCATALTPTLWRPSDARMPPVVSARAAAPPTTATIAWSALSATAAAPASSSDANAPLIASTAGPTSA